MLMGKEHLGVKFKDVSFTHGCSVQLETHRQRVCCEIGSPPQPKNYEISSQVLVKPFLSYHPLASVHSCQITSCCTQVGHFDLYHLQVYSMRGRHCAYGPYKIS